MVVWIVWGVACRRWIACWSSSIGWGCLRVVGACRLFLFNRSSSIDTSWIHLSSTMGSRHPRHRTLSSRVCLRPEGSCILCRRRGPSRSRSKLLIGLQQRRRRHVGGEEGWVLCCLASFNPLLWGTACRLVSVSAVWTESLRLSWGGSLYSVLLTHRSWSGCFRKGIRLIARRCAVAYSFGGIPCL